MDEVKDFRLTLAPESATNNGLNKLKLQAQTQLAIMAVEQKFLEEAIMHNQTVLTTMEDTKETGQSLDKTVASRRKQDAISENIRIMTKEWEKINRAISVHYKLLSLPEHYLLALSQGKTLGVKIDGQEVKVNRESLTRGANIANEAFSKAIGKTVTHEKVEEPYLFDQIDTKAIKKEVERAMSEASIKNKEITVGDVVERVTEQFQNREASQKKGPSEEQLRGMLGISKKPEKPRQNESGDIFENVSPVIPLPAGDKRYALPSHKEDDKDLFSSSTSFDDLANNQDIDKMFAEAQASLNKQQELSKAAQERLDKANGTAQDYAAQKITLQEETKKAKETANKKKQEADELDSLIVKAQQIAQMKAEAARLAEQTKEKNERAMQQEELNNDTAHELESLKQEHDEAQRIIDSSETRIRVANVTLKKTRDALTTPSFNLNPNSGTAIFEPTIDESNMGRKK